MEAFAQLFLELYKTIGLGGAILVLVGFVSFVFFIWALFETLKQFLIKKMWRKKSVYKKFGKKELLNHGIFMKYKNLLEYRLKKIKCQCPLRREIFSDLMCTRVKCFDKTLRNFIGINDFSKMDAARVQLQLESTMYCIFQEWEEKAVAEGIPKYIVEKFAESLQDLRQGLIMHLKTPNCTYELIENNYVIVYSVLDVLDGFEEVVISRLEMTLDAMNGEISKSNYKGIKCQHCQHCVSRAHQN